MQFDFAAIDTKSLADEGVLMTVREFHGDKPLVARNGEVVKIKLRGPDSDVYRDFTRRQVKKRFAKSNDPKQLSEYDFEEMEQDALDVLAAVTVSWEHVFDTEGAPIPFSTETARLLYASYPVLREQVESFVATRLNFLRASSES